MVWSGLPVTHCRTTLQALELTNGSPLALLLEQGAAKWVAGEPTSKALIEKLYKQALLRSPTPEEQELAIGLLGERPTPGSR